MNFLRCNSNDDTQALYDKNVQMISIHFNQNNTDFVKHNDLNGTKLIINIYS